MSAAERHGARPSHGAGLDETEHDAGDADGARERPDQVEVAVLALRLDHARPDR